MEKFAFLLEGYTPVLLFIFICFAALLLIFYRTMRGLDELVKSMRKGGKPAPDDTIGLVAMRMEELVRMQAESLVVLKSLAGMSLDHGPRKEKAPYRIPEEEVESIDYAMGDADLAPPARKGAFEDDLEDSMIQASRAVAGSREREQESLAFDAEEVPFAGMADDDLDLSSDDLGDMSDDLDLTTDMGTLGDEAMTQEFPQAETVAAAPPPAPDEDDDLDLDLGLFDEPGAAGAEDEDEGATLVLESDGSEPEEEEDDALAMLGAMDDTDESPAPPEPLDLGGADDQETMFADLGDDLAGITPEEAEDDLDLSAADIETDLDDDLHMEVAESEDEEEPDQDDAFMEEAGETLRSMEESLLGVEAEDESFEAKAARSLNLSVGKDEEEEEAAPPMPPAAPEVEDDLGDDLDLDLSAGLEDLDLGMETMAVDEAPGIEAMEEDEIPGLDADTEDEPDLDSTMALDDLVDRLQMEEGPTAALSVEDDLADDLDLGATEEPDIEPSSEPEEDQAPPEPPLGDSMDGDTLEGAAIDFSDLDDEALSDTLFIRKTPAERDRIAGFTADDLEEDLSGPVMGDDLEGPTRDLSARDMEEPEVEEPEIEEPEMEEPELAGPDLGGESLGDTSVDDGSLGDTSLDDESLGIDLDEESLGLTLGEEEFGDLSVEDDLGDLSADLDGDLGDLSLEDDLSLEAGDIEVPDEPPAVDDEDEDIDIRVGGLDDGISDDTATFDLDDLTNGLGDVQVEIMSGVADDEELSFGSVDEDEGMGAMPSDDDLSMTMNLSDDDLLDLTMDDISDDNAGDTLLLLDQKGPRGKGGKAQNGSENIVDYIIEE